MFVRTRWENKSRAADLPVWDFKEKNGVCTPKRIELRGEVLAGKGVLSLPSA